MFLDLMWFHRYNLREEMKTSGEEVGFWDFIHSHFKFQAHQPVVSDSHCHAYRAAEGCDQVVLFDAHHDCWDTLKANNVACDNWLRAWLEEVPTRTAVWVYPAHAIPNGAPEIPEDMLDRVSRVKWEDFKANPGLVPRHEAVGAVHVCRSGCWTPPWLDGAFIEFSKGVLPRRKMPVRVGSWNPLAMRWTKEHELSAKAYYDSIQSQMRELQELTVVQGATSGTFLNGRVEVSIPK